jgi:hypothetical protein
MQPLDVQKFQFRKVMAASSTHKETLVRQYTHYSRHAGFTRALGELAQLSPPSQQHTSPTQNPETSTQEPETPKTERFRV